MKRILLSLLCLCPGIILLHGHDTKQTDEIPPPEQFFGFQPGSDGNLFE